MWAIWDFTTKDWLREPLQEFTAILAFDTKRSACGRAAQCWGYDSYSEAKADGWCEVRKLNPLVKDGM